MTKDSSTTAQRGLSPRLRTHLALEDGQLRNPAAYTLWYSLEEPASHVAL